jgi:integrase
MTPHNQREAGTVGDMIDTYAAWMRRRSLAQGTIDKRVGVLRLVERAGPLETLDHETIERFLDGRQGRTGPLAPRSRVCWLSHLRCFYQWALAHEHVERDPTARLVRPRLRRQLPRPITEADYRRALEAASTPMLRAWLLLAGNAGLRVCEIATLRGEDIASGSLRVTGKGGRDRVVPMHWRLVEASSSWRSSGPVFVDPATGAPYSPQQVSRLMGAHLRRCGVRATAHQLRHRFASEVYGSTGDLAVVAELCGHESIETTRIYAAVSPTRRASAVAGIA